MKGKVMSIRRIFMIALAAVFAFAAWSGAVRVPRAKAQIPAQIGAQRWPSIDVDKKNKLYLMMSVATGQPPSPHSQIFFTTSKDGGTTWDNLPQTRNLSKSPREDFGPSLAVTKQGKPRAYTVFQNNNGGGVFLLRSKKGTKFKTPPSIVPPNGGTFVPRLALDSTEALNVVWGATEDFGRQVFFVRSTDMGETFTEPLAISRSQGLAFEPEIAVGPDDAINLVWEDTATGTSAIRFSRSTDSGQTFSVPVEISRGEGDATEAHIAADGSGRLYIVWIDARGGDLQAFFSRSTDNGETFSDPINLSQNPGADIHKIFVTTFKDTVYVAYNNDERNSRQVLLQKSEDAGLSFSEPVQVSQADRSRGRAHSVSMVADKRGTLHIVWIDSSIIGSDEGLLFYSNTKDGRNFSAHRMLLAAI